LGLLKEFFKNPGLKRDNYCEHLPTIDEEYSSINGAKSAGSAQK
jgi:hypothetical protein